MALVNELARVLGINLLASFAARLPARVGTSIELMLVVAGSLLPLWPLYRGWVQLQDLLAYAALWMTLSVISTLIRLNTMTRRSPKTRFFALHYTIMIGALSLVSGAWAVILLLEAGPSGGWFSLIPTACALVLANAWSLADGWFVRGGNRAAKLWQVLLPGYLRFVPVLGATISGAVLILGDAPQSYRLIAAAVLMLIIAGIDITLAVASVRLRPGP